MPTAGTPKWDRAVFAVLCLVFGAVTLVWLWLNRAPPSWDDAWYLTNSLVMYDAWTKGGLIGFVTQFLAALEYKAPLIAALPAPFYLALGRNWRFGYLVNLSAMLVLFAAIWAIGRRCWNSRVGLIAVCIAGTMPLLYGLSRWFMVEYALTAAVAVVMWLLLSSDNLENGPATAALGALCGIGLLLKVSFPVFVLAPMLFALWRCKRKIRALVLLAIPCLAFALPWYALHWRATLKYAVAAGYGESGAIYETGTARYLGYVIHQGVSDYYAVAAAIMSIVIAFRRRFATFRTLAPLGLWAVAFLPFLFGANKGVRLIAPILPAFALATAWLVDAVAGRRAWLLPAVPFISMLAVSFAWPYGGASLAYARVYDNANWRQHDILDSIRSRLLVRPGEKKLVVVGSDRALFNVHNFELTAVQQNLPLAFETTAYKDDLNTILAALDSASFVIVKDGGEAESAVFNHHPAEVLQFLRATPGFEEIPFARPLPDGGLARLFGRGSSRAPAPTLPPFHADFGGIMKLTGLAVNRIADVVEVKRHWRALKPMERDYWTFTHILNAQDKMVAQLDHRIQNGDLSTSNWSTGEEASEGARITLPPSVSHENLRLRFGVYYPATGERLIVNGQDGNTALTSTLPAP